MEQDWFIREPEVKRLTGLSRTTRWRLERKGEFPQRRQLSENAVGWLDSEISLWIASRTGRGRGVLPGAGQCDAQPMPAGQREDRPDEVHHNIARRLSRRQSRRASNNLNHHGC
jgi:prophage regulatory protein